ncbi:MAG: hypothetical protein ABIS20_14535 [Thermoanaerobaculia bacterium]
MQIAELLDRRFVKGIRFTGLVPKIGGTTGANPRFEALEVIPMDEDVGVGVPGNPSSAIDGADQRAPPGHGSDSIGFADLSDSDFVQAILQQVRRAGEYRPFRG